MMHSAPGAASDWVARFAASVPQGEVLDLACGSGRHARLFAGRGYPVVALDRDSAALAACAGPGITTLAFDLEQEGARWPFAPGRFSAIVVTNYLHRALFPEIMASLAPHGLLIYETFALGNEAFGKPSNPAFLLRPAELLAVAAEGGLQVLAFEDGIVTQPKPARIQRLCAARSPLAQIEVKLDHLSGRE